MEKPQETTTSIFKIIGKSAYEAIGGAFCLIIATKIGWALIGGILGSMLPFEHDGSASDIDPAQVTSTVSNFYQQNRFLVAYIVSFAGLVLYHWSVARGVSADSGTQGKLVEIGKKIGKNWFSLLVGNAIGAMISATVLVIVQQFTLFAILFDTIIEALQPILMPFVRLFAGGENIETAEQLIAWYHDNEVKLLFWPLYISAILDDLGLPNLKTLGKGIWRHFRGWISAGNLQEDPHTKPSAPAKSADEDTTSTRR